MFHDTWKYEFGEYTSKIAYHFSGGSIPWGHAEDAWAAVTLYRKLLSEAEDASVTIASIGFFDNVSFLHMFVSMLDLTRDFNSFRP